MYRKYKLANNFSSILMILLIGLAMASVLFACTGTEEEREQLDTATSSLVVNDDKLKPVQVVAADSSEWLDLVQYAGELKAVLERELSFATAGRVGQLSTKNIGQIVTANHVVANLEKDTLQLNYERSVLALEDALLRKQRLERGVQQPQIDSAVLQIERSELRIEQLETELLRTQALLAAGAVPATQLEAVENQLALAKKDMASANTQLDLILLEAVEEDVRMADLAYANALLNQREAERALQRTTITAPFTGTLLARYVELGQFVQAGQAVLRIADMSSLELIIDIPQAELAIWQIGTEVELISTQTGAQASAVVREISSIVTAGLGTREVQVILDNQAGLFTIGEQVLVRQEQASTGVLLPVEAVLHFGESYVFLVKDNIVERRVVDVGEPVANLIKVHGVELGEQVVVAGMERIFAGDIVEVTATNSKKSEQPATGGGQ